MIEGPFTFFGITILLAFLVPYFYFKRQRKLFFRYIQDKKYTIVKNVETDIETYSKIEYKFFYKLSDIVFLEDEIFIITRSKFIIDGRILQIGKNSDIYPGVFRKFNYHSKIKIDEKLEIKGKFDQVIIKPNFKIVLYFRNKTFDINSFL